jgi:hypothetical protein
MQLTQLPGLGFDGNAPHPSLLKGEMARKGIPAFDTNDNDKFDCASENAMSACASSVTTMAPSSTSPDDGSNSNGVPNAISNGNVSATPTAASSTGQSRSRLADTPETTVPDEESPELGAASARGVSKDGPEIRVHKQVKLRANSASSLHSSASEDSNWAYIEADILSDYNPKDGALPAAVMYTAEPHLHPDVAGDGCGPGAALDGVYLQWSPNMTSDEIVKAKLKSLSEKCVVGVWTRTRDHVDSGGVSDQLAQVKALTELGVRFVNTDFPRMFLNEGGDAESVQD